MKSLFNGESFEFKSEIFDCIVFLIANHCDTFVFMLICWLQRWSLLNVLIIIIPCEGLCSILGSNIEYFFRITYFF